MKSISFPDCSQPSKRRTSFLFGVSLAVCALTGCQCVSPRIEGRVVDAKSHQPIKGVMVKRLSANEDYNIKNPSKGGEIMERAPSVSTSETGEFALESVKDVAVFRHLSWYSVSLAFSHPGYTGLMATYTLVDATNNTTGEPTVHTGDILLVPQGE